VSPDLVNREGETAYDVTWPWHDGPLAPGLTCVFRVKDEARNLPWVLPPVFEAVQHVVLVDNGSSDGTAEVAQRVVDELGVGDRYTALSYPFAVARAGAEHLATPPDSVHSLTYFYNWSFSHVRTAYSMKWDGDMVLTREGVDALRDASWQLERTQAVLVIPRHPVTVVDEQRAWIDLGYRFLEPWVYPMGPGTTFAKAFEWEVREWPASARRVVLPEGLVVEVRWMDLDELSHWSDTEAFDDYRTPRKKRELDVLRAIETGTPLEGLVEVVAPPGVHVVDHVTGAWMARAERPLCLRLDY
jgi:glycosyltransferase involved in cell wall biosynthesis